MSHNFISQRKREHTRVKRVCNSTNDVVLRPSQRWHDLQRSRITDGITSSTGLFDEAEADVHDLFNPEKDKFDIANALINDGLTKQANDIASKPLSSNP